MSEKDREDCVFRIQHWDNMRQEWRDWFKTRDYRMFQEAIVEAEKSRARMERANRKAERDWTDKGYGSFDIPPMRVVKICGGEVVSKKPATSKDFALYTQYRDFAEVYEKD